MFPEAKWLPCRKVHARVRTGKAYSDGEYACMRIMRASDDELVLHAQSGAPRAFDQLVARHRRAVYQLALRVTSNPHDAEEIVQDTLLVLHRRIASFRGESKFSTWLYSVTRNAALMHVRQRPRAEYWRDDDRPSDDERPVDSNVDE